MNAPPSSKTSPAEIPMLWTDDLRDALTPRRGRGPSVRPKKVKASAFWSSLCEGYLVSSSAWQWAPERADAATAATIQLVIEALRSGAPLYEHATPEQMAVARHVGVVSPERMPKLLDLLAQTRGVPFALATLLGFWRFSIEMPKWPGAVWLVPGFLEEERLDSDLRGPDSVVLHMRALLAGVEQEAYDACVKQADALRRQAPLHIRAAIAVLFPEQTAWVNESCREVLAVTDRPIWHRAYALALLGCSADLELALACAARIDPQMVATIAPELADTFGASVLELLLSIFATDDWAYKEDRALVARVLSIFGTDKVADAMLRCLKSKALADIGTAWCMRFPEVARPALVKLAASKSKLAAVAAELLEKLPTETP